MTERSTAGNWLVTNRGRALRRAVLWLAWSLAGLELLYLVAANTILGAGWVEQWVSGEDRSIAFESAYSVWPGTVHLRQFRLTTADRNTQLELTIDRATVDVSLHDLASQRFHLDRAETHGTRFKLRHNVSTSIGRGRRLAAFPPIEGYEGLPLYDQKQPPPKEQQSSKSPWTIHIENVEAQVDELWVLEVRYVGDAQASGAFELKPGRELRLWPSELEVKHGTLSVADAPMAGEVHALLRAEIARTDLQKASGASILGAITASVDAALLNGDLQFLDAYLEPYDSFDLTGTSDASLAIRLDSGRIAQGSYARLGAPNASITTPPGVLRGDLAVTLQVDESDTIQLSVVSAELGGDADTPQVIDTTARVEFAPTRLTDGVDVVHKALRVRRVEVPDLGWLQPLAPGMHLSGRASASGNWQAASGGTRGQMQVRFDAASVGNRSVKVRFDGEVSSKLTRDERSSLVWKDLRVALAGVQLQVDSESADLGAVSASSAALRLLEEPRALQGTLDIVVSNVQPVLTLFAPDLPANIAGELVGLDRATARVAVHLGGKLTQVEILNFESGALELHGKWRASGSTNAAFVLETSLTDVGIAVDASGVNVETGVSDQFIESRQ